MLSSTYGINKFYPSKPQDCRPSMACSQLLYSKLKFRLQVLILQHIVHPLCMACNDSLGMIIFHHLVLQHHNYKEGNLLYRHAPRTRCAHACTCTHNNIMCTTLRYLLSQKAYCKQMCIQKQSKYLIKQQTGKKL